MVYRRHPVLPYAYELTNYDYLAGLLSFQKGYFYIQDISSMQVAEWAEPKEGDYVIDVCAAPGGKSNSPCGKSCLEPGMWKQEI